MVAVKAGNDEGSTVKIQLTTEASVWHIQTAKPKEI
jgi:hypothetical protein